MNPLLDADAGRLIIGHRGAAAEAPENTLPSFRLAIERRADALELDVRVTADGVPVVVHDATLDRTTNRSGPVGRLTLEQLRLVDAGYRFTRDGGRTHPWRGRGVTVPTLADVLAATTPVPLIVEIKKAADAAAIREVLDAHGGRRRCLVGSFEAEALASFRAAGYATGASQGEVARALVGSLLGWTSAGAGQALTIPEYHRGIPVAARPLIRAARRGGRAVHVWTVDDPARAGALWERGVNGIITNDPRSMVTARSSMP